MTNDLRLHAAGDPELPALAAALSEPGTELLGHRPGRRAVLREPDGHYVKVVRPRRTARVVNGFREAAARLTGRPGAPAVPRVCSADLTAGWVRLDELPGPSLHELLHTDPQTAAKLCVQVAGALAALGRAPTADLPGASPASLPRHTHADEAAVLHRWLADADGRAGSGFIDRGAAVSDLLLALPDPQWALCHRDLHDKQLLRLNTTGGPTVGLLDLDTLCVADPALDAGNLLAHLLLRILQGHCRPSTATRCARILYAASLDDGIAPAALKAYITAALLRLAAVYTLRPGPPDLPARLAATMVVWSDMDTASESRINEYWVPGQ
ncbi:MAG: phosphotransferase [Pseudonocardiaceae bacterium]